MQFYSMGPSCLHPEWGNIKRTYSCNNLAMLLKWVREINKQGYTCNYYNVITGRLYTFYPNGGRSTKLVKPKRMVCLDVVGIGRVYGMFGKG